jgi:hypothetical protein
MSRSIQLAVILAVILGAGALFPAGPLHAQALPGWKIADICASESAPGQCAASEGSALQAVSASWSLLLAPIKQSCLGQLGSPDDRSWRLLAQCIDAETLKAVDKTAVRTAKTPAEPVAASPALTPAVEPESGAAPVGKAPQP